MRHSQACAAGLNRDIGAIGNVRGRTERQNRDLMYLIYMNKKARCQDSIWRPISAVLALTAMTQCSHGLDSPRGLQYGSGYVRDWLLV